MKKKSKYFINTDYQQQMHTITRTDLIFVRQLEFSNDILEEIENYNYTAIQEKTDGVGFNQRTGFDNGGAWVVGKTDWEKLALEKPTYLDKVKQLVIDQWHILDPDVVIRDSLRANLNIVVKTNRPSDIHADILRSWTDEWSALVHLNESDGPTEFVASKIMQENVVASIPHKAARLIIFPSIYAHRGLVPTDKNRYSLSYIFKVDTKFNSQVLKQ